MVALQRWFSPRSLALACSISTVLLNGGIQGANAAALEIRQEETTPVTTTTTSGETTTTTAAAESTTTEDTASTTTSSDSTSATASPPSDDFPVCTDPDVKVFCEPENGKEMWPGETYYVTWNSKNYPRNSTITVELNYANSSTKGGQSAYSSPRTDNRMGYVTLSMEEDWLQGHDKNNLTLYLVMDDPSSGDRAKPEKGATISLVHKPAEHHPPPPQTPVPNKLGLAVGLPVGLGAIFLIALGLCIGMRKNRRIGLGSVMGRKKGYGTGKSIGQRLGGGSRRQNDAIRLGELEEDPDRYTDDPDRAQRRDSEADERMTGQSFRPDIGRLKNWRY